MGTPALEPSFIPFLLILEQNRVIALYAQVAALTALFCDYFSTLEREIEYFWKRSWTWGSLFYFMNRYFVAFNLILGLIAQAAPINDLVIVSHILCISDMSVNISLNSCYVYQAHLSGLLIIVQALWAEAAFAHRVLMILNYDPLFKYILTSLFIGTNAVAIVFSQLIFKNVQASTRTIFGAPACTVTKAEFFIVRELYVNFTPLIFYHTVVAAIGIWAFTREIRSTPYKGSIGVRLLSVMRWQAIAIFAWALFSMTANSLIFHFAPGSIAATTPMCLLITSILAARLMIIIKEEAWSAANCDCPELHISMTGSWQMNQASSEHDPEWVFASATTNVVTFSDR